MIAIHTYYCPACGTGRESSTARRVARGIRVRLSCPRCGTRLRVSGPALLAAGVIGTFVAASGFPGALPTILLPAAPVLAIGLLRSVGQAEARWRRRRTSHSARLCGGGGGQA